jgi:hypothetical protein
VEPINQNWTNDDGTHAGGQSTGVGFTIAWQRGPLLETTRNGAFVIEVLEAVRSQIAYYQDGKYACAENQTALDSIDTALFALNNRRDRRKQEGTLGTHKP